MLVVGGQCLCIASTHFNSFVLLSSHAVHALRYGSVAPERVQVEIRSGLSLLPQFNAGYR